MHARSTTALILLTLTATLAAAPQNDADRAKVIDLAKAGRIGEAISAYDKLTGDGKTPDRTALAAIATGAAAAMAGSANLDARLSACGSALLIDQAQAMCRRALETIATQGKDSGEQALAAYTLANAGLRVVPGLMSTFETNMTRDMRLLIAQTKTRLPPAERLSLLRPLLGDREVPVQYQAVLALVNVPGDDAAAAIRNADPGGPVGMVRSVALARHGDAAAAASLAALMPSLNGYLKIQAGRALAENLNPKGIEILEEMRQSPVDLDRVMAAEALGRINPDAAYRTLIASLSGGSAAVKPAALHAAGVVRMGTDPAVYHLLGDADETIRAAAIDAVAETLAPPSPAPARGRL